MKRRGNSPGLKWNRNFNPPQPYWVARQVVRDPCGYPDKTIRLPSDATADELAALCRDYTARLYQWIEQVRSGVETFTRTQYDGTVRSLNRIYQEHPDSRFHEVSRTRASSMSTASRSSSGLSARALYATSPSSA
jgi:hypothetical protein